MGEIIKLELPSVTVLDPIRRAQAEEYRDIPSVVDVDFMDAHLNGNDLNHTFNFIRV